MASARREATDRASAKAGQMEEAGITSVKVFRKFMRRLPNGELDASDVVSSACYAAWLEARKHPTLRPEKAFQRTLAGHLTGSDGRKPFTEEEEVAVLRVLRRRQRWPCFEHLPVRYGETGFRVLGYHERMRDGSESLSASSSATLSHDSHLTQVLDRVSTPRNPKRQRRGITTAAEEEEEDDEEEDESAAPAASFGPKDPETEEREYFETMTKRAGLIQTDDVQRFYNMNQMIVSVMAVARKMTSWVRVWDALYIFARMRLFAFGFFNTVTEAEAQLLLQELEKRYPSDGLLVISMAQPEWKDRFLAQNAIGRSWFGPITKRDGGFMGKRMEAEDAWSILMCLMKAHSYPGVDHEVIGRYKSEKGLGPSRRYKIIFRVDPQRRLTVERTQLLHPGKQ